MPFSKTLRVEATPCLTSPPIVTNLQIVSNASVSPIEEDFSTQSGFAIGKLFVVLDLKPVLLFLNEEMYTNHMF